MHKIHELKERLMHELGGFADKDITTGNLATVDTLAHAVKNLCKIIESADGDYDDREYSSRRGMSYRRDSRGRYASRYSNANDEMVDKLTELMETAPEEMRGDIQRLKSKVESMR